MPGLQPIDTSLRLPEGARSRLDKVEWLKHLESAQQPAAGTPPGVCSSPTHVSSSAPLWPRTSAHPGSLVLLHSPSVQPWEAAGTSSRSSAASPPRPVPPPKPLDSAKLGTPFLPAPSRICECPRLPGVAGSTCSRPREQPSATGVFRSLAQGAVSFLGAPRPLPLVGITRGS